MSRHGLNHSSSEAACPPGVRVHRIVGEGTPHLNCDCALCLELVLLVSISWASMVVNGALSAASRAVGALVGSG